MDEILNRILSLLKEQNVSKGKFLSDLEFDRSALSEWVKGRHKSYMRKLPDIADYFGVSLDWLAGNEQKNKPLTEREKLNSECLDIMDSLPEDLREVAHEHLKSLAALAEKNKKK